MYATKTPVEDVFASYKLNTLDPLPAEEQRELARQYQAGDERAGAKLIETNLRLVISIAKKFSWSDASWMDLIQAGNEGLCKAISKYDPDETSKFTSYAQYWIRALMFQESWKHMGIVRVDKARGYRKALYKISKARAQVLKEKHEASPKDIAALIEGVTPEIVHDILLHRMGPVELDKPFSPGGRDTRTLKDRLVCEQNPDPVAQMGARSILDLLNEYGKGLSSERRKDIWFDRVVAEDGLVLSELATRWGVSKERIRQVEKIIKSEFVDWVQKHHGLDFEWTGWSLSK